MTQYYLALFYGEPSITNFSFAVHEGPGVEAIQGRPSRSAAVALGQPAGDAPVASVPVQEGRGQGVPPTTLPQGAETTHHRLGGLREAEDPQAFGKRISIEAYNSW